MVCLGDGLASSWDMLGSGAETCTYLPALLRSMSLSLRDECRGMQIAAVFLFAKRIPSLRTGGPCSNPRLLAIRPTGHRSKQASNPSKSSDSFRPQLVGFACKCRSFKRPVALLIISGAFHGPGNLQSIFLLNLSSHRLQARGVVNPAGPLTNARPSSNPFTPPVSLNSPTSDEPPDSRLTARELWQ